MTKYKYEGATFKLDDSKGCYVEVTYKHLTGHVGVNLQDNATDERPYIWIITRKGFQTSATADGLTAGNSAGASFEANRDALCAYLLKQFRTEEAAKTFNRAKYCKELHAAVKKG